MKKIDFLKDFISVKSADKSDCSTFARALRDAKINNW